LKKKKNLQLLRSFIDQVQDNQMISFKDFTKYLEENDFVIRNFMTFEMNAFTDFSQLNPPARRWNKNAWISVSGSGYPLIYEAVAHKSYAQITQLVEDGADINLRFGGEKVSMTALIAIIHGSKWRGVVDIQFMMELGANIYFQDEDKNTILDHVLNKEHVPDEYTVLSVKFLLKNGLTFKDESYAKYRARGHNPFRHSIKDLLDEARKAAPPELITLSSITTVLPPALAEIVDSYVTPRWYGYFSKKNPPQKQLFLEDLEDKEAPKEVQKSMCRIQ